MLYGIGVNSLETSEQVSCLTLTQLDKNYSIRVALFVRILSVVFLNIMSPVILNLISLVILNEVKNLALGKHETLRSAGFTDFPVVINPKIYKRGDPIRVL